MNVFFGIFLYLFMFFASSSTQDPSDQMDMSPTDDKIDVVPTVGTENEQEPSRLEQILGAPFLASLEALDLAQLGQFFKDKLEQLNGKSLCLQEFLQTFKNNKSEYKLESIGIFSKGIAISNYRYTIWMVDDTKMRNNFQNIFPDENDTLNEIIHLEAWEFQFIVRWKLGQYVNIMGFSASDWEISLEYLCVRYESMEADVIKVLGTHPQYEKIVRPEYCPEFKSMIRGLLTNMKIGPGKEWNSLLKLKLEDWKELRKVCKLQKLLESMVEHRIADDFFAPIRGEFAIEISSGQPKNSGLLILKSPLKKNE